MGENTYATWNSQLKTNILIGIPKIYCRRSAEINIVRIVEHQYVATGPRSPG